MIVQVNIVEKGTANPCGSNSYPFKRDKCNQIYLGAKDAERYMGNNDEWEMNWINAQSFAQIVEKEKASDGDVLFMDAQTAQVFFKLPGFFVDRENVTKVIRLMLKFKYQDNGGVPGYVVNDPQSDENGEFWSMAALETSGFRSKFGINVFGSPLAALMGFIDSAIDDLIPDLTDLVPWFVWAIAAGYTGLRTKQTLPAKPTIKNVGAQTYAYGLGTGYLLHLAIKSAKAKKAREEAVIVGINAPKKAIGRYKR